MIDVLLRHSDPSRGVWENKFLPLHKVLKTHNYEKATQLLADGLGVLSRTSKE
jgi:hypothetical protein